MELAPIIIFAFNRPNALKNTISSLLQNEEAQESELFIFVDGARNSKEEESVKVEAVQTYAKSITGFKKVTYTFSQENKGLGKSIIEGVTKIINQYGKAIVLEDDLFFANNFLSFMNQGLKLYEKEKKVFSICGYTNKIKVPKDYLFDAYFCTRSSSWGWATWADRWNSVDWELKNWDNYSKMKHAFNKWGGSDCFRMLRSVKEGWGDSWAIRFGFSQFLQDKLSLFPIISKVKNDGFDGNGTNCKKWSRFRYIFDETKNKRLKLPTNISINSEIYNSAMSYHSIMIRLWSRLMYLIH
jgi:glycosyltransferase involved in cell wall biosynthesis